MLGGAIDEAALTQVVEHEHAALVERHQVGVAVAVEVARPQRAHGADRHVGQRAFAHRFERTGERVAQEVETSAVARGREIEIAFLVVVERQHSRVAPARETERGAVVAEAPLPSPRQSARLPPAASRSRAPSLSRSRAISDSAAAGDGKRDRLGETIAGETDLERAGRPRDQARQVGLVVAVEVHCDQPTRARCCPLDFGRAQLDRHRSPEGCGRRLVDEATDSDALYAGGELLEPALEHRRHQHHVLDQDRRPPRRLEVAGLERVDHRRHRRLRRRQRLPHQLTDPQIRTRCAGAIAALDRGLADSQQDEEVLGPELRQPVERERGGRLRVGRAHRRGVTVEPVEDLEIVGRRLRGRAQLGQRRVAVSLPHQDLAADRDQVGALRRQRERGVDRGQRLVELLLAQQRDREVGVAERVARHRRHQLAVGRFGLGGALVLELRRAEVAQRVGLGRRRGARAGGGQRRARNESGAAQARRGHWTRFYRRRAEEAR